MRVRACLRACWCVRARAPARECLFGSPGQVQVRQKDSVADPQTGDRFTAGQMPTVRVQGLRGRLRALTVTVLASAVAGARSSPGWRTLSCGTEAAARAGIAVVPDFN